MTIQTSIEADAIGSALIHRVFHLAKWPELSPYIAGEADPYFVKWIIPEYNALCDVLMREYNFTPAILRMRVFA